MANPAKSVVVRLSGDTDLANSQKILANVLGKLGCGRCYSGFDIRFEHVRELVINPKTFEAQEFGF